MKKLVLVVAMFMFVCGGSFFAMAQKPATGQPEVVAVNDTVVPDTTKQETVSSMLPSADLVMVNDTVVPDTTKAE